LNVKDKEANEQKLIMQNTIKEYKVKYVKFINDTLYELCTDRKDMDFEPGDCVAIHTAQGKSRPYSIASGQGENLLRFLIRKISNGEVSTELAKLKKNDIVRISSPFGWFRPGHVDSNSSFVFFATGTGISPFLSYLLSPRRKKPLSIYYGIRRLNDLNNISILKNVKLLKIAVSQEKTNYHSGRITDMLDSIPIKSNIHYYCCGNESMINEVSKSLRDRNIPLSSIHREVFFHG
tara:strand:- start:50 stop:754 length:705 start_codon:yes stop_codon:yes gene_type:complete